MLYLIQKPVMVKRCAWGTCKSDTRYPNRVQGVVFHPFPKPKTNLKKCLQWIRLCGRPADRLKIETISKNTYVCSKHFVNGCPTDEFPDPLDALDEKNIPKSCAPPPNKKQKHEQPGDRTERIEFTTDSNTGVVCAVNRIRNKSVDPVAVVQGIAERQCKSTSVEDTLRMTAYIQAEEIKHLKKLLSERQFISVTPELINNSIIFYYFEYCTGFTYDAFNKLCTFLRVPSDSTALQMDSPLVYRKETAYTKKMPLRNQFLLVLMKLRNNYDLRDLAFKFQIDVQSVNIIFSAWINYLYLRLGQLSAWPRRDVISVHMPDNFKKDLPTTFAILDCTELKLERPMSHMFPSQIVSDKSTSSLKGLVASDPRGGILFVSKLYSGFISDKDIFQQCSITTLLHNLIQIGYLIPGDALMADKGFQNQKEVEEIGLCLSVPPFAKGNEQKTKKMAKHRMNVKKAIEKIKKFKIVADKIPSSLLSSVNKVWFVVSMLTNFQPHILSQ